MVVPFAVVKFTEGRIPGAAATIVSFDVRHRVMTARADAAAPVSAARRGRLDVLACEAGDSAGELTAVFYGRAQITGVEPGTRIRLHGMVGIGADGRRR